MHMFRLRLLGGVSIEGDDGVLTGPVVQKHRLALLALLGMSRGGSMPREKLAGLVWPEADPERGRHRLREALRILRRELGSDAIASFGDQLRLDPDVVRTDVAEFEALAGDVTAGGAERAAALYRGPFLDGFFLPGAVEYEHWAEAERRRIALLHQGLLESLATNAEDQGDYREAVGWWKRLQADNPTSAAAAAGLIRSLAAAGDRAEALRQARVFSDLMRDEFGVEPDPEIMDLVGHLRKTHEPETRIQPAESILPPAGAETPPQTLPARSAASRRILAFGAIIVVAAVTFLLARFDEPDPRAALDPQRVLVFGFANGTGDPRLDVLGRMSSDWITQGLARSGLVDVVPFATALRSASAPGIPGRADADPTLLREIVETTGAGLLVTGSYYAQGDSLVFQARIVDAATGAVLRGIDEVGGSRETVLSTLELLRQRATGALAGILDPRLVEWSQAASQPPGLEAYQRFADGLDLFFRGDYETAAIALRESAELDSTFTAPLLWSLFAYANSGLYHTADSLAHALDARSDKLAPWDRAMLDHHLADFAGDRVGAYQAMRRVVELSPYSEWKYEVALTAYDLNQVEETVEVLESLDAERGWMREWPNYWGLLAVARHKLGDYRRELEVLRRGQDQHPGQLVPGELRALVALGAVEEVLDRVGELRGMDQGYISEVSLLLDELNVHGHVEAIDMVVDSAIAWFEARPESERQRESTRRHLAMVLYAGSRWDRAYELFTGLASEDPQHWGYQADLGLLAARRGDRAEALRISAWLAARSDPYAWGLITMRRAEIAAQLGLEEAIELLESAFEEGLQYRMWVHPPRNLEPLQGDPRFARMMQPRD